jgi:hypothetical protein
MSIYFDLNALRKKSKKMDGSHGVIQIIPIFRHIISFILLCLIANEGWCDSTNITSPIVNSTPQSGVELSSGRIGYLRCGWAKSGSTNYNNYDAACNNGTQISSTTCHTPLSPSVSVSLIQYQTCSNANMYGIALDQPTIGTIGNSYYLYWKQSDNKHLYAGYNGCDDRAVMVSYVLYCN